MPEGQFKNLIIIVQNISKKITTIAYLEGTAFCGGTESTMCFKYRIAKNNK